MTHPLPDERGHEQEGSVHRNGCERDGNVVPASLRMLENVPSSEEASFQTWYERVSLWAGTVS